MTKPRFFPEGTTCSSCGKFVDRTGYSAWFPHVCIRSRLPKQYFESKSLKLPVVERDVFCSKNCAFTYLL
ncbi:MAG: hypothetical protein ABH803_04465 [Candidatus Micrarchaeota archaeon]